MARKRRRAGVKWGRVGPPKSAKRRAWLAKIRPKRKGSKRRYTRRIRNGTRSRGFAMFG